ncbi:myo-inosose-2 dehydratase [Alphaproteobacteria bacterium]|nr:myo-inosose-2 dehydratase [Alphaproteobacteria bacterium]
MVIKIGIAPIAWSNDDMPELGGDTPIETCLEEAKLAGFSGIELGGKFPRNPGITNFLLEKYKLKMPGGWYGAFLKNRTVDEEWETMQDHINLLKIVKADVFVFADVSESIQAQGLIALSKRPELNDNEWKTYSNKISELSNRLNDIGIPMSYHAHMGTIIQTEEDIDRLMNEVNDKTYLLYDTGHLLFAGSNYQRILEKYVSKINHVHCKDIREGILKESLKEDLSFRESFLKGVFTVPGDGCIDYIPLLKLLKKNNYNKWLVIEAEQDPKKANPLEYAKKGYRYLNGVINKIGYKI